MTDTCDGTPDQAMHAQPQTRAAGRPPFRVLAVVPTVGGIPMRPLARKRTQTCVLTDRVSAAVTANLQLQIN